jgi:hypothetical protein
MASRKGLGDMSNDYKRDLDDFMQSLQDREDETRQREEEQREKKLRRLADGLRDSLKSLRMFEQHGLDIVKSRDEILAVLKQCLPEVWSVPEAQPLIHLLFPNRDHSGGNIVSP